MLAAQGAIASQGSGGGGLIDRTTPVTVASGNFDTSGNGGRRLVRLSNGWLVAGVADNTNATVKLYISKDKGNTYAFLTSRPYIGTAVNFALSSKDTMVYLLATYSSTSVIFDKFNAVGAIEGNAMNTFPSYSWASVDSSQTALGNCSITLGTDGNLHGAWASKNATYPNSFNIRYSKGTINGDGSVTWATPTQVTTINGSGTDCRNPTIVVGSNNYPTIIHEILSTNPKMISSRVFNGTTWGTDAYGYTVYNGGLNYNQAIPSATVDSNGVINVAWCGYDATASVYNIRYSKSLDNGVTWSTPVKLTAENTYGQVNPSITCDLNNDLYIVWNGANASITTATNIRMIKSTSGTWGAITEITTNTSVSMQTPSVCDNYRNFEKPLMIYKEGATAIKFTGKWTEAA